MTGLFQIIPLPDCGSGGLEGKEVHWLASARDGGRLFGGFCFGLFGGGLGLRFGFGERLGRFSWNVLLDATLKKSTGADLDGRDGKPGSGQGTAGRHDQFVGKKGIRKIDLPLDYKFVAGDLIEACLRTGTDPQFCIGQMKLPGEDGAVVEDDLRRIEMTADLGLPGDEECASFDGLYLHLGAALDADQRGVEFAGNLGAVDGDDFTGRAQLAEDFSPHLDAASGRFHALEGAAFREDDIVVGEQLPGLDAAHDFVAQLEVMEAADALGRERGAGDEIGSAALDADHLPVRLGRAACFLLAGAAELEIFSAVAAVGRNGAFGLGLRRLAMGTDGLFLFRLFHGLVPAEGEFLQFFQSEGPLARADLPDPVEGPGWRGAAHLELSLYLITGLQNQGARFHRAKHRAARSNGQAPGRFQVAFEFSGDEDVPGHAHLSPEREAGMDFDKKLFPGFLRG